LRLIVVARCVEVAAVEFECHGIAAPEFVIGVARQKRGEGGVMR
jgi:hypothetical protein